MDINLLNILKGDEPTANKEICEGLAWYQLKNAESYIHEAFLAAAKVWPKKIQYMGPQRCTPEEQFVQISRKNKKQYEMARSDVFLVKYLINNSGTLKYVYFLIPFGMRGSAIYLGGALYKLTPVIGGKIFNIEDGNIFTPIPKNRSLVFQGITLSVTRNGKFVNTNGIYSPLHHFKQRKDRSKHVSLIIHYMLAEFGLDYTLNKIFNLNCIIGELDIENAYHETHDIYRSSSWKRIVKKGGKELITGSSFRIAVPKENYQMVNDNIIASIFYIIDNYQGVIHLEDLNNKELWLILLDKFIFKIPTIDKKGLDHLNAHMHSVKNMLDKSTVDILISENIYCNDIFDLFKYVIYDYNDMVIHEDSGTMFNKELTILKYFLYNIVHAINTFTNEIIKFDEEQLNEKNIAKKLDDLLPIYAVLSIKGHGELTPVAIATDFMPHFSTCNVMNRAKAASGGRNKRTQKIVSDPNLLISESQTQVTTFDWLSKADPAGRGKLNPFLYMDRPYHTSPDPLKEDRLKNITYYLKQR